MADIYFDKITGAAIKETDSRQGAVETEKQNSIKLTEEKDASAQDQGPNSGSSKESGKLGYILKLELTESVGGLDGGYEGKRGVKDDCQVF